jgi:hypothetical protein
VLIAYDDQQPAARASVSQIVAAAALVNRISGDVIGFGHGSQHVATPRVPPTVETTRLLLRGWRRRDLKAHAEMSADPQVMR